eukprot:364347-Chlamydomonas_euryale.AAC.1
MPIEFNERYDGWATQVRAAVVPPPIAWKPAVTCSRQQQRLLHSIQLAGDLLAAEALCRRVVAAEARLSARERARDAVGWLRVQKDFCATVL